jgi:hypothetical protein
MQSFKRDKLVGEDANQRAGDTNQRAGDTNQTEKYNNEP